MKQNVLGLGAIAWALAGFLLAGGCSKPQSQTTSQTQTSEYASGELEIPAATKEPYRGNLTPEKAAEITNAVAKVSLSEIPTKDLPKDPNMMMEINKRIKEKSEAVYMQYGTTMSEVMRYISDLSPKDRELYNKRLTDLFLSENKRKYDAGKVPIKPEKPEKTGN